MATLALELALFALFCGVKTETNGQMLTVPVELNTTVDFPCKCHICPDSTVAVQWYRSSDSEVYVKDGTALAWWYEGETGSSQGFGIKDDFSMIMYSVHLNTEGLYRCIVTPLGVDAGCTHDTKVIIFANPDNSSPMIEYIQQTNGFNVTCSISNVFPMTFPILTSKEGNGTAYINRDVTGNKDGTFNTTVTCWFPANEKDTTIECLYSNFNLKSVSSLRIVGSDTIDQNMTHDTDNTDCRTEPSGVWMVWIILITEVLFFIVIVYAIKTGRVRFDPAPRKTIRNNIDDIDRDEHHGENSKEEEPAKSTRIRLFGKLSWVVITFTIQIAIVAILSFVYLATTRCLTEITGGNKKEIFQQNN